jgi:hypothetical protein
MDPILTISFALPVLLAMLVAYQMAVEKLHLDKSLEGKKKDGEKLTPDSRKGLRISEHREKLLGLRERNSEPWIEYLSNGGFGI